MKHSATLLLLALWGITGCQKPPQKPIPAASGEGISIPAVHGGGSITFAAPKAIVCPVDFCQTAQAVAFKGGKVIAYFNGGWRNLDGTLQKDRP